jgi:hypothetical protein
MALSALPANLIYLSHSDGDLIYAGEVANSYGNTLSGAAAALNYYGAKCALIECRYTLTASQTYASDTVYIGGDSDYPGPLIINLPRLEAGAVNIGVIVTALVPFTDGSIYCYRSNPGGAVYTPVRLYVNAFTRAPGVTYG